MTKAAYQSRKPQILSATRSLSNIAGYASHSGVSDLAMTTLIRSGTKCVSATSRGNADV
jgi:hypothetical protein